MHGVLRFALPGVLFLAFPFLAAAQLSQPPVPLPLSDDPHNVQTPAYSNYAEPECDSTGAVYLRHPTADDTSWKIARVDDDGNIEETALGPMPDTSDSHTFVLAIGEDGSVYEIARIWTAGHPDEAPRSYYVRYDPDGSFRSREAFDLEFIPSVLVPLPNGNFFAAGVSIKYKPGTQDIDETPLAAIFDSDARLLKSLQDPPAKKGAPAPVAADQGDSDTAAGELTQGGLVRLGDDGNIYMLFTQNRATLKIFRQSGQLLRTVQLQEPFEADVADGLWVSGNRLLVSYEGEADDPHDSIIYMLYDVESGQLIRAYRPQYSGTIGCFQDGQTVSVFLPQKLSGTLATASADLR